MGILDDIFQDLAKTAVKAVNKGTDSVLSDAEKKIQRTRVKVQKTIVDLDDNMEVIEGEIIEETGKGR